MTEEKYMLMYVYFCVCVGLFFWLHRPNVQKLTFWLLQKRAERLIRGENYDTGQDNDYNHLLTTCPVNNNSATIITSSVTAASSSLIPDSYHLPLSLYDKVQFCCGNHIIMSSSSSDMDDNDNALLLCHYLSNTTSMSSSNYFYNEKQQICIRRKPFWSGQELTSSSSSSSPTTTITTAYCKSSSSIFNIEHDAPTKHSYTNPGESEWLVYLTV